MSKTREMILSYTAEYPNAPSKIIAKMCECSADYVRQVWSEENFEHRTRGRPATLTISPRVRVRLTKEADRRDMSWQELARRILIATVDDNLYKAILD